MKKHPLDARLGALFAICERVASMEVLLIQWLVYPSPGHLVFIP